MSGNEPAHSSGGHNGDGRSQLYPNLHPLPIRQPNPQCHPDSGQHPESVVGSGICGSGRGQMHSGELQNYHNPGPGHPHGFPYQFCHSGCSSTYSHPSGNTSWPPYSYSQTRPTAPHQGEYYPPNHIHHHNIGFRYTDNYPHHRTNLQPPQQPCTGSTNYPIAIDTKQDQVISPTLQNYHGQVSVQGQCGYQNPETGASTCNSDRSPMSTSKQNVSDGYKPVQIQHTGKTQQGTLEPYSSKTEPTMIDRPNPDLGTQPKPSCPEGSAVLKESKDDGADGLVEIFKKMEIDPHGQDYRAIGHGQQTGSAGKESLEGRQKESPKERPKESQERHSAEASYSADEVYQDRFLLSDLTEEMGEEILRNYAEVVSGYEVIKTEYSTGLSSVVVTFDQPLDEGEWKQCSKKIAKRKIEGKEVRFSHIPLVYSVCVRKTPSIIDPKTLEDYFSSPTSGNKSGSRVTRVKTTDDLVVVTFEEHVAVEDVLAHGKHDIDGQTFNISVYYDNIGCVQERSDVTTKVYTRLSCHEIQLLEVSGLLGTWLTELTHLDEASIEDKDKVKLKGTETDIQAVEDKFEQFKNSIVDTCIECSAPKMEYLLSSDGKAHTLAKMKAKNIESIWFRHSGRLKVMARSRNDLESTKSWFVKHIFEIHHDVLEESQSIIEEKLDTLRRDCVKIYEVGSFCLDYIPETRSVRAVAQHEVKYQIEEELKKTFPKPIPVLINVKKEMLLPQHIQKFMRKYMAEFTGKAEIIWKKDSIILCGQTAMQEFEKAKKRINENDIVCGDMKIPLDKVILDCFCDYIERTERCIIMWQFVRHPEALGAIGGSWKSVRDDPENPNHDNHHKKRVSDRNGASGGHRSDNAEKNLRPSSRRNRRVWGFESHQALENVHRKCLSKALRVNSDSPATVLYEFKHVGSPSTIVVELIKGEIAKAQADVIVNVVDKNFSVNIGAVSQSIMTLGGHELKRECKRFVRMSEGQYEVTGAGKLKCKKVIHCHLALKDNPKAAEILIDLIVRMLEEANKSNYTSIALPALGTGALLQYDPEVVAGSMYSAVHRFEQRSRPSKLKEVQFVLYPSNTPVLQAFQKVERSIDAAQMRSGGTGCQTSQGKDLLPMISIVSGELAEQEVDVIVNSSNTSLILHMGAVSKSILEKGGVLLQSECREYLAHHTLNPGGFVVTHGGKLKCRNVYHACLPAFSSRAFALLSDMVRHILEAAAFHQVESIAFPAFGTGNLKYPSGEVAEIMFNTIHEFRMTRPHSLKHVLLVVYTKDTGVLKSFKSEEEKFLQNLSVHCAHGKPGNHHHKKQHSSQADPGGTLRFGACQIVVKQGDITKETVECIVNPINKDMDLHRGSVSKALLAFGGKSFQEKTRIMGNKLMQDRVVGVKLTDETTVLHVRRDLIESNQKQAMLTCLNHADKKDYKTIAFPVLKTGADAQVVEEMARDLHSAVSQVFENQTIISCISVVIYQPAQVQQFYDKAKELAASGIHDFQAMERETQRSEGFQQVCFKWCSDDPLCKMNVEMKISKLQHNGFFTETVPLPPYVDKEDLSEEGKELSVNITWSQAKHSISVMGKGHKFLKELKFLHQLIERKVAEKEHSAYRKRAQSDDEAGELFGAGRSGKFNEALNMPTVNTKETIRYGLDVLPGTSLNQVDSFPCACDPGKHGNQTNSSHYSEGSSFGKASNTSASSKQYEEETEERANTEASPEAGFAVSREATRTAHPMKWYYLDGIDEVLESYDQISDAIEQSYLRGDQTYKLPDSSGQNYLIDFAKMEEVDESNPEDKVPVLRREDVLVKDFGDMKLPRKWTKMEGDIAMVTLKASEDEYAGVKQVFETSSGGLDHIILKIERLQNKSLCGRFMAKKKQMGNDVLEKKLWHSCQPSTDCIIRINNHGTNLNYCQNKKGEPLGEGIYFLDQFGSTITTYSAGSQYAFLCRVLVGVSGKGKPGLRDPPPRPHDESSFLDSVVDNVKKPSIYVIFSDAQVYPEYLVTYKINKE